MANQNGFDAKALPRTVCDLIEHQGRIRPHAVAVRMPTMSWTYADLLDITARWGHRLRRRGAGPGSLVGLLAPLGPSALVGLVAILRCGAACMPLDPDEPPARLGQVTQDAGCGLILTTSPAPWCRDTLVISDPEAVDEEDVTTALTGPTSLDLAYALTTSGSTGRPKAVGVPHRAILNLVAASMQDFALVAERDVVLWSSRPTVDVTMQDCLMALCSGATLAIPNAGDFLPRGVLTAAGALGATVVDIPAAVVGAYGKTLLPRLAQVGVRIVITGGSRLDGAGLAGAENSPVVYNAYGPTETTVTATMYECTTPAPRWPPIGRAIRGVRTYVLDDRLTPVPAGADGQLYLGGECVSWGYLGQPGRTAAAFLPDPFTDEPGRRMYATGDRVRLLADGNLKFLDRIDNQVKVSGFRIEVGEVEHVLHECSGVREAAVVVREDVPGGACLVAFLAGDRTRDDPIKDRLRDRLPRYMLPKIYVWLDEMPLNRQGKVDLRALATAPLQDTVPSGGAAR